MEHKSTLSTPRVYNEAHFSSFCCRAQQIGKTPPRKGGEIRRTRAMHDSEEIQQHSLPFPTQVIALQHPKSLYTQRLQAGAQALVKIHEKQTCNPKSKSVILLTTGQPQVCHEPCYSPASSRTVCGIRPWSVEEQFPVRPSSMSFFQDQARAHPQLHSPLFLVLCHCLTENYTACFYLSLHYECWSWATVPLLLRITRDGLLTLHINFHMQI